jgi:hypothetical protein
VRGEPEAARAIALLGDASAAPSPDAALTLRDRAGGRARGTPPRVRRALTLGGVGSVTLPGA